MKMNRCRDQGLWSGVLYIKCRKIEEIGSWVKKARVCRTNEQWKQAWAQGNQNARDTAEAMTRARQRQQLTINEEGWRSVSLCSAPTRRRPRRP
ncbi:hypothetical protein [Sphingopyxis alaskensis]|uniref:hypothetical protein n=1 Tax=Sphingopyxis alaskensis TaxID=117207 RepID=UPI00391E044D